MSVRVVARVRPLLPKELDKDVIVRVDSTEDGRPPNVVKIPSPKNEAEEFSFAFNGVYDQATSQEELFNAEGTRIPTLLLPIPSSTNPPYCQSPLTSRRSSRASTSPSSRTASPAPARHTPCAAA